MGVKVFNVLFLCTHNSARSVVAECVMNKLGQGRFRGFSAGSMPRGTVNPFAVEMLGALGYDVSGVRSKSWNEFAEPGAPHMDLIITVCDDAAGETCPVWPGRPAAAHWGVADPSRVSPDPETTRAAFKQTHRQMVARIGALVALPLEDLDAASLKARLAEIGAMDGATDLARLGGGAQ